MPQDAKKRHEIWKCSAECVSLQLKFIKIEIFINYLKHYGQKKKAGTPGNHRFATGAWFGGECTIAPLQGDKRQYPAEAERLDGGH